MANHKKPRAADRNAISAFQHMVNQAYEPAEEIEITGTWDGKTEAFYNDILLPKHPSLVGKGFSEVSAVVRKFHNEKFEDWKKKANTPATNNVQVPVPDPAALKAAIMAQSEAEQRLAGAERKRREAEQEIVKAEQRLADLKKKIADFENELNNRANNGAGAREPLTTQQPADVQSADGPQISQTSPEVNVDLQRANAYRSIVNNAIYPNPEDPNATILNKHTSDEELGTLRADEGQANHEYLKDKSLKTALSSSLSSGIT